MNDRLGLVWIAIAIAAGVAEVFTLDLVFLMVAGGAIVAAVIAAISGSVTLSIVGFAVATIALVFGLRPPLKAYMHRNVPAAPMHTDALIGLRAIVTEQVDDTAAGRVRVKGEIWSARTTGAAIPPGQSVYVHSIDGATAIVGREPLAPSR